MRKGIVRRHGIRALGDLCSGNVTMQLETFRPVEDRVGRRGVEVGQRYHRVDSHAIVWRVVRLYRDAQGVAHATLADDAGRLDKKTLSAAVLQDRSRYRLI